jgi:hypothetical protein
MVDHAQGWQALAGVHSESFDALASAVPVPIEGPDPTTTRD